MIIYTLESFKDVCVKEEDTELQTQLTYHSINAHRVAVAVAGHV